ncbi:MAG: thiopurine S-methyltransferase [Acidobacteria bacterium]|nr:thiopurine S-methyltransferase [Acidobacteriota bacterium]
MEHEFWFERWRENRLGFDQANPNPLLVNHFGRLAVPAPGRVFVPMCGKTIDIAWLLEKGYRVVGSELVPSAIEQLIEILGLKPQITAMGDVVRYACEDLDLFAGDIFCLQKTLVGPIDATYDRAALVALPQAIRKKYAEHLVALTGRAPQLLISFDYDQSEMAGPPFSVTSAEINSLYGERYNLKLIDRVPVPGGLKGICDADECVWLLN